VGEQSRARGSAGWADRRHDRALPQENRRASAPPKRAARQETAVAQPGLSTAADDDDQVILPDPDRPDKTAGEPAPAQEQVPAAETAPARQGRPGELARVAPPAGELSPAPSWGVVLGNTARLWRERHGLRQAPGASRSRARTAAFLLLVLVVFAAGALTAGLIWRSSPSAPDPAQAKAPGGGAGAAAVARTDAARWVAGQVSPGAIVGCDPVMCDALEAQHFPAGSLLTLSPSSVDPLGATVVAATAAVRSDFGSRLTSKYAPVSLAAFGSGTARIEILVVAPDGVPAYQQALTADQEARRQTGAQLAGNPLLRPSPAARADLAGGRVDARLMATLVLLTGQHLAGRRGVDLLAFSAAAPGADPAVPLRTAELVPVPGAGASYLTDLRSLLRQQIAPFLASTITITRLQNGRTVLLVGFDAPGQLGVLGTQSRTAPPSAPAKASGKKAKKESPHTSKSSH
jgi:hypothetical protein